MSKESNEKRGRPHGRAIPHVKHLIKLMQGFDTVGGLGVGD